jgi:hypothetical protein
MKHGARREERKRREEEERQSNGDGSLSTSLSTSTSTFFLQPQLPPPSAFRHQGRDKHENENLIAHALPHDIWFHVEDMSSAHVYLRPPASLFPPAVVASAKPGKGADTAAAPSPSGRGGASGEESPPSPPLPRPWHEIPKQVLADCCQLVKHNSISGSKAATVDVVYTPAPNLLKNYRMDTGQVRRRLRCTSSLGGFDGSLRKKGVQKN